MTSDNNQEEQKIDESEIDVVVDEDSETVVYTPKKKGEFPIVTFLVALLGIGAIAFMIIKPKEKLVQEEPINNIAQAKLTVKTVTANSEPIQAWVFSDGYVNALTKKHLTFQAEGTINYLKQIDGRDLREGDFVTKGELLARVDRRKYDSDITVAKAEQVEANNQVISAFADLKKAEESLIQAKADQQKAKQSLIETKAELQKAKTETEFTQAQLKRYQLLYEQGAVDKQKTEVEDKDYKNAQQNETIAEAKVNSAIAQLDAAEAKIRSQMAQVEAAKAKIESAQAGIKSANAQLDKRNVESEDTDLVAPFSGVITRLNIREGEYWTPNIVSAGGDYQTITERLPIIMIDPTRFEVNVELPAFRGGQVKPGQQALVILDQDRNKANSGQVTGQDLMKLASARGTVFSVSPSVSPGERSVRVTIRINQGIINIQD